MSIPASVCVTVEADNEDRARHAAHALAMFRLLDGVRIELGDDATAIDRDPEAVCYYEEARDRDGITVEDIEHREPVYYSEFSAIG